ncbi:hypothetical protein BH10BAC5_BH10BAC5_15780 [soil metagenome]
MKKVALLRVGADSGNLGFHGLIKSDGNFVFIPINETFRELYNCENAKELTYSNCLSNENKKYIEYFTESNKFRFKDEIIHNDPEFVTFTYGDPSVNKNGLNKLCKGDYLIFYSSLINIKNEVNLYAIAYFEIESIFCATNVNEREFLLKDFKNNFHVKHESIFARDVTYKKNGGLKLVKGSVRSKFMDKAVKISERKVYGSDNRKRFVISEEMQEIFGSFGGKISIERNALRMITEQKYVKNSINWGV